MRACRRPSEVRDGGEKAVRKRVGAVHDDMRQASVLHFWHRWIIELHLFYGDFSCWGAKPYDD